jgi:hypothetical protein
MDRKVGIQRKEGCPGHTIKRLIRRVLLVALEEVGNDKI